MEVADNWNTIFQSLRLKVLDMYVLGSIFYYTTSHCHVIVIQDSVSLHYLHTLMATRLLGLLL
jgi:hypothetical protein